MPEENKFTKIESLVNYVAYDHMRRVLRWPMEKIAYEMWVNLQRLTEWVNSRGAAMTVLMKGEKGQVEKIRAELEMKYPAEAIKESKEDKKSRERVEKLDVRKVAKEYKKDLHQPLSELADKFNIPFNDFRMWWSKHLQQINAQVKLVRN